MDTSPPERAEEVRKLLADVQLLLRSHSFSSVSRFRALQRLLKDHPEAEAIAAIGKLFIWIRILPSYDAALTKK